VIRDDGWDAHAVWEHSAALRELYAARARDEAPEMTCAAQAAELLAPRMRPGETVLDAGCGSGYLWHSLRAQGIAAEYHGIDASATMIDIGRQHLPAHGLPADRLRVMRIEDLDGEADHVVCMNVISNLDNIHRPLERLLEVARRTLVLRESLGEGSRYTYVTDEHLDDGARLKVHVNRYDIAEVTDFIASHGFTPRVVVDRRSGGAPEMVIGHPHWWTFVVAER
jgi:cyclopropane fatty-acyl-phospholipid synthase-like methyltransferase